MKRIFDILFSTFLMVIFFIPMLLVAFLVKLSSDGPVLYWSNRVGRYNQIFRMPKFRTMRLDSPEVASSLLLNPCEYMTPVGLFLRKSSLDELPQLWSILIGHMSFVGPRPALFNQGDLIQLRDSYGISELLPGLTGLAQINGRDELSILDKVSYDAEYLRRKSFVLDITIIWLTILRVINRSGISH